MQWLILVLIALYPCPLSESDSDVSLPPSPPSALGPARHSPGPLPRLGNREISKVQKENFIAQFELQAGAELVPCLHRTAGHKGSITFMARLHQKGIVSGVRVLSAGALQGLDDCALRAVEKMQFRSVGAGLAEENVEVSWRFDF